MAFDPDRFARLQRIFDEAQSLPPEDRAAFVKAQSAGDAQLERQANDMLALGSGAPTEAWRAGVQGVLDHGPMPPQAQIGKYRLLDEVGRGSYGVVYRAERADLESHVAIKVSQHASEGVLSRFDFERRALSSMSSPYIARLFDAGETEAGQPYFVMELVDGVPLHHYCRERGLDLRSRLELFCKVCEGVRHAHGKGIVHRDLKPANVLVGDEAGVAVPKVLDFGLAKALEGSGRRDEGKSVGGEPLGTYGYMSPEQARGRTGDMGVQTDVFALGAMLFELLCDEPTISQAEIRRIVDSDGKGKLLQDLAVREPQSPSARIQDPALRRRVRGDLDVIVRKAMANEVDRRYETVAAVAEDIENHLQNRPIQAAPDSVAYVAKKFVRRNWGLVVSAGLVLLVGVTGAVAIALKNADLRVAIGSRDVAIAQIALQAAEKSIAYGDWVAALNYYDTAERSGRVDRVAVAVGRHAALDSLGRLDEARACIQWLKNQPDLGRHQAQVDLLVGYAEYGGDAASATQRLLRALECVGEGALRPANTFFAKSCLADNITDAVQLLEEAVRLEPWHRDALRDLSFLYLFNGEPRAAARTAAQFSARFPLAWEPQLVRGVAGAFLREDMTWGGDLSTGIEEPHKGLEGFVPFMQGLIELIADHGSQQLAENAVQIAAMSAKLPGARIPHISGGFDRPSPLAASLSLTPRILALMNQARRLGSVGLARVHPCLRNAYPIDDFEALLRCLIPLMREGRHDAVFNGEVPPERLFWLIATMQHADDVAIWEGLQPAELAQYTGLTSGLHHMGNYVLLLRVAWNIILQAKGQAPAQAYRERLPVLLKADIEATLQLEDLREEECYAYVMLLANFLDPSESRHWVEGMMERWLRLHGATMNWKLMQAELALANGTREDAVSWLAAAERVNEDNSWVSSLQARLGR